MRNWIFSTQATTVIVVGVASFFLLCGPTPSAEQEIRCTPDKPSVVRVSEDRSLVVVDESLETSLRFQKLIAEWHEQRAGLSWAADIAICPAYQSIIGLGPSAIPLILAKLKSEGDDPDHWFWALRVITGLNPVADQDQGDILKMSEAWLRWGIEQGYAG